MNLEGIFLVKSKRHRRIPDAVDGIQINFCKNPHCLNFGVPAPESRGAVSEGNGAGSYTLIGTTERGRSLSCHFCRRTTVLRSNLAISQELIRFNLATYRNQSASCTNQQCDSFGANPIEFPNLYYRHGTTRRGEPRFRCKRCGATFSSGAPIRRQRRPELNAEVLKLLVNKVPMRRMCEVLDINPTTLYGKLAYLAEVMVRYCQIQELQLQEDGGAPARAYVSIDRQDHFLNWGTQFDRRNIMLGATAAVENNTGYVLAAQLNFDSNVNAEDVEADAIARGDYDLPPPYRYYARLCLRRDFELGSSDDDETAATDVNEDGFSEAELKAPHSGMQVHLQHTQYALLFHLKKMLHKVERLRLFVDRDPGLDTACLGVFAEDVRTRRVDVFVIKTAKLLTMQDKKRLVSQTNRELKKFNAAFPSIEERELKHQFVKHQLKMHRAAADVKP